MTRHPMRGVRALACAVVLAVLFSTVATPATAHEQTTTYTYYVDVTKTREVPKYKTVTESVRVPPLTKPGMVPAYNYKTERVRVAPFKKTETVYNYDLVCVYGICYNVRIPPYAITLPVYKYENQKVRVPPFTKPGMVPAYNYRDVTKRVRDGTRTETYTVSEERTGTRPVDHDHSTPTPTPTPTVQPGPTTTPDGGGTPPTPVGSPCPAGQTYATARFSPTPSRLLVGYNTPEPPDGFRWKNEHATPTYACFSLERKPVDITKRVIGGIEYTIRNGKRYLEVAQDHVESAAETAAKATVTATITALEATDRFLERTLCSFGGQGAVTVGVAAAGGAYVASQAAVTATAAAVLAAATTATVVGAAVTLAILAYCEVKANTGDDDSAPDTDDTPDPTPTVTATPTATPAPTPTALPVLRKFPRVNSDTHYIMASQDAAAAARHAQENNCVARGRWAVPTGRIIYVCPRG